MPRRQARGLVAAYGEWCDVATEPQLIVAASRLEQPRPGQMTWQMPSGRPRETAGDPYPA